MHRLTTSFCLLLGLLNWSLLASAAIPTPTSWDGCLQRYAEDLQLDPDLFRAIIYTESRNHPYAFGWTDRKGIRHSVFPETLQAAKHQLEKLKQSPYRYDSGLGQINSLNVARLGTRLEVTHADLLHPCTNLYMSSVILRETLDRHGYRWKAIAAYNGSDAYIGLVWNNLCRRHHPAACAARGWTERNLAAPLPTDALDLDPAPVLAATEPTPAIQTGMAATHLIAMPSTSIALAPAAPAPIDEPRPLHPLAPTQEESMLSDAVTHALPAMFATLSLCLRVLLPFAVFVATIVLIAYGLRTILWAIRSVTTRLRAGTHGQDTDSPDPAERWRTSPALSSRIRSAA